MGVASIIILIVLGVLAIIIICFLGKVCLSILGFLLDLLGTLLTSKWFWIIGGLIILFLFIGT